jgi:hypothetical protein
MLPLFSLLEIEIKSQQIFFVVALLALIKWIREMERRRRSVSGK